MSRNVVSGKDISSMEDAWLGRHQKESIHETAPDVKEFRRLEPTNGMESDKAFEPTEEFTAEQEKEMSSIERNETEATPESKAAKPDDYKTRLLKYIPAEVVALYLTLDAILRSTDQLPLNTYWAVFIVGIVGTYLYLHRVEKVYKNKQLLISVVAYCIWVFALGGPFVYLEWYHPIYGGMLLPIYTFFVPIIEA